METCSLSVWSSRSSCSMYSMASTDSAPFSLCHLKTSPEMLICWEPSAYSCVGSPSSSSLGDGSASVFVTSILYWALRNMYPVIITLSMSWARFSPTVLMVTSKYLDGRLPSMFEMVCFMASTISGEAWAVNWSITWGSTSCTNLRRKLPSPSSASSSTSGSTPWSASSARTPTHLRLRGLANTEAADPDVVAPAALAALKRRELPSLCLLACSSSRRGTTSRGGPCPFAHGSASARTAGRPNTIAKT
mmetsp:Transcript_5233/g.18346  ORF Transcript_5233/g.18346 Transcript_5233/m.18346 type:complete len:248 (+) Transcript_5233:546-1289(+)